VNSLSVENAAEFAQKTVLTIVNMNEKDVDFLKQYSSPLMCSVCLCKSCRLVIERMQCVLSAPPLLKK
jgi:recombinational DNA repair protein RecR